MVRLDQRRSDDSTVEEQKVNQAKLTETPAQSADLADTSVKIDAIILDKYQVVKLLGMGGMGSVYLVRDLKSRDEYALKFLNSQHTSDTVWRRFDNEVRAAGKLDHPNLIKVHDFGLLPDGRPYFVMDFVHGVTLAEELKSKTRLPLERTLKIMIQVAFAMAYAHDNGIIHRDIKPSNIMICDAKEIVEGNVKLVDFGIAKLTGQDAYNQMTLTRTGEIFGSPLYMSPEQCAGIATDHRSDLYSFGCVLYEALTGAPPILADSALATMSKHQTERPVPMKEASLGVTFPGASERIVAKLLEKDPDQRYQNAHELLTDLVRLERHLVAGSSEPNVVLKSATAKQSVPATAAKWYKVSAPMAVLLLVLGFAVGLCAGPGLLSLQKNDANSAPQSAPVELKKADTFAQQPNEHFMNKDQKYFSLSRGLSRFFLFPSDSIGQIKMGSDPFVEAKVAENFENFLPLHLVASEYLYQNPEYIEKFRPDELIIVELRNCDENVEKLLNGLTKQTVLKVLCLRNSNVTDACLPIIDKISSLVNIDFTGAHLDGAALAKMKILKNLNEVEFTQITNPKPLVVALKKAHSLTRLELSRTDLDGADIAEIGKMKSLNFLDLTDDKLVNDKNIGHLAELPLLLGIDMENCPVTPASIPIFKRMPMLHELHISGDDWSAKDKERLQAAFGKKFKIDWRLRHSTLQDVKSVVQDE